MKPSLRKGFVVSLLLLLFCGPVLFELTRKPWSPEVSVSYLGLTNRVDGSLCAAFSVDNLGLTDIRQPASHIIMRHIKDGASTPHHPPVSIHFRNTLIAPGQNKVFTVAIPGEPGPWRASVAVYESNQWHKLIKFADRYPIRRILPENIRNVSLATVHSDWVEIAP